MSNKRRNRKTAKSFRRGIMGRARAQMKLAANLTEEQDWYLDTPDVRLTKIFTVVVGLHLLAGGGILAFKMVDKASESSAITITTARQDLQSALKESRETAAKVPAVAVPVDAPARTAPPAPLRRDPSKGEQHKVLAGETLAEIAAQHGVTPEALKAKNSIVSENELYPGRWLTLPGNEEVRATPVADTPPASAATESKPLPNEYTVKAGDTPWAIARQFNVSFNQLMKENGISNAQSLQIGQKLRIPAN